MANKANLKIALLANRLNARGPVGHVLAFTLRQVNRVLFCCDIGIGADIDPSCVFHHSGLGCVIHANAVVGPGCRFFQHVTIGSAWRGGVSPGERVPRVGRDVLLGAGCVLLGDIDIGDGATIGANAVVTKTVPAGAVVVGVPGRVIGFQEGLEPPVKEGYRKEDE